MSTLKKPMAMMACLVTVWLFSFLLSGSAHAQTTRDSSKDMAKLSELMPQFVVKVYAQHDPDKPEQSLGTGSGELVRSDGVVRILTNAHVVGPAETVFVQFDGQDFAQKVRVIGRDPLVDLALLEAPSLPVGKKPIPIANVTSVPLVIGQAVYAIGYPSGNRTITPGSVGSPTSPMDDSGIGVYLTHTAPIAPGSSGGALVRFSATGEVELAGINTLVGAIGAVSVGIGYSIKPDVIAKMLPKLETGQVAHAFSGMFLSDTTRANPYIFKIYPPARRGTVVLSVPRGFPADSAGIQRGDMIKKIELEYNGAWQDITDPSASVLSDRIFFDVPLGSELRVTTLRGTQEIHRKLTVVAFPVPNGQKK